MVTIGVDAHKRTHTMVAVDRTGHEIGQRTASTTSSGHLEALRCIAITQLQRAGAAHDFVARRRAAGSTKTEAIRSLRRYISDEVYRRLRADEASLHALAATRFAAGA